ncbi:MAG: hypothetical protein ACLT5U_05425 [Mediterraneibacter gnavus]
MKYTQNKKIEQVTDKTMVVGIDIGSQPHYTRAFDNCGRELKKESFCSRMTQKDLILFIFGQKHLDEIMVKLM